MCECPHTLGGNVTTHRPIDRFPPCADIVQMLEGDGNLLRSYIPPRSHGITLQVRQMRIAPTVGLNLEFICAWLAPHEWAFSSTTEP